MLQQYYSSRNDAVTPENFANRKLRETILGAAWASFFLYLKRYSLEKYFTQMGRDIEDLEVSHYRAGNEIFQNNTTHTTNALF